MLNKPKIRLTNQRKMIMNFLLNTDKHPTAEEIFLAVRNLLPQISFATVYRNLNNLVEEKLITALDFEKGPTRYDAKNNDAHFVCRRCHRIHNVKGIDTKKIIKKISKDLKSQIETNTFYFFGVCNDCLNEIEKLKDDAYFTQNKKKK